jgi:hypothetical protein
MKKKGLQRLETLFFLYFRDGWWLFCYSSFPTCIVIRPNL